MPKPKTSVLTAVASATIRGPTCSRSGSDGLDNENDDEEEDAVDDNDDDEGEEYGDLENGELLSKTTKNCPKNRRNTPHTTYIDQNISMFINHLKVTIL